MFHTRDQIVAAVHASGRRLTRQRLAIIDYLAGRNDHPSARQIFKALKARESRLSLATVYNTLATLVDIGLLEEMEFETADNRYDTNLEPHINLVCTVCGAITDVNTRPPVSADAIQRSRGFHTTGIRMEYRGVCASCATKDRGPGLEES